MERRKTRLAQSFWAVGAPQAIFFALAFAASLTFVYVEGDDARSAQLVYLGLDHPAYAKSAIPYHSMTSLLLSGLPTSEPVIRVVQISVSAAGAVFMTLLVTALVRDWCHQYTICNAAWRWIGLLLPLLLPELVFLGLVFEPILPAMTLLLAAHLLARNAIGSGSFHRGAATRLAAAAVLYGLGVSLRWDTGFYGNIIAVDLLVSGWPKWNRSRLIATVAGWGIAALTATVAFLYVSGYAPADILQARSDAQSAGAGVSLRNKLSHGVTFLTPMTCLLLLAGGFRAVTAPRVFGGLLLLYLAGSGWFLLFGIPSFSAKSFLTVLPVLVLTMCLGWQSLESLIKHSTRTRLATITSGATLLLLPWAIGIHWPGAAVSRGPGFEARWQPETRRATPYPSFSGGLALPSPEGPRPLWGFGHVLFRGEWRNLVQSLDSIRERAVNTAEELDVPIHLDSDSALLATYLIRKGYTLKTERERISQDPAAAGRHQRVYARDDGRSQQIALLSQIDRKLNRGEMNAELVEFGQDSMVVIYTRFSRFKALVDSSNGTVSVESPLSGVWRRPEN